MFHKSSGKPIAKPYKTFFSIKRLIMKKRIVVLTGAGISAESGFSTFRDADGLWENYPVEQVATPEGWHANPNLVTDFYNHLRSQLADAQPNDGHLILAQLEKDFDVTIVTQNIDDLHERAGSSHIIHLHGDLRKMCSSREPNDPRYIITLPADRPIVEHGTLAGDGSLLRPWIVWFGEAVPNLESAAEETEKADIFVIIGTSLNVYPAASLIRYTRPKVPVFLIDPKPINVPHGYNIEVIQDVASKGMRTLQEKLQELK